MMSCNAAHNRYVYENLRRENEVVSHNPTLQSTSKINLVVRKVVSVVGDFLYL